MDAKRQFVVCRFRPTDERTYTYHNDGAPVQAGDEVKVPDNHGDGWKRVEVVHVHGMPPRFATKPILGRLVPVTAPETAVSQ